MIESRIAPQTANPIAFSRPSSMSDGSPGRIRWKRGSAPRSKARRLVQVVAAGGAAAALTASLSAFSAAGASRASLVAAPRSGSATVRERVSVMELGLGDFK